MPHTCRFLWTPQLQNLKQSLDQQTGLHPLGGWAYVLWDLEQFQVVADLHVELCLALGQASDAPGEWAPHGSELEYGMPRIDPATSALIGTQAAAMRQRLVADGTSLNAAGVQNHPNYGSPSWLGMDAWDPQSYQLAGNLLLSMRNALDR